MSPEERLSVVPLIKVALPADDPTPSLQLTHEDSPILEPLIADLLVAYAFDEPDRFRLVNERDVARMGIAAAELRELAIGNLHSRLPRPEFHGTTPAFMVTCGGNFEASLLLLDDFWTKLQQYVPGRIVAAVPARDLLFFTGEEWPHAREFLEAAVSKNLARADLEHPLSAHLLARGDRGWSVLDAQ